MERVQRNHQKVRMVLIMTTEEIQKLSPEEKQIAIAEAIGWRRISLVKSRSFWSMGGRLDTDRIYEPHEFEAYLDDLNAALTLINFLAERGCRCRLGNGLDKTWECEFMRKPTPTTRPEFIGEYDREMMEIIYAPADTLAQAICDGFLLALP